MGGEQVPGEQVRRQLQRAGVHTGPREVPRAATGGAEEWPAGDDRHHFVRDGGGPPWQRALLPLLNRARVPVITTKRNACRPFGGCAESLVARVCMCVGSSRCQGWGPE